MRKILANNPFIEVREDEVILDIESIILGVVLSVVAAIVIYWLGFSIIDIVGNTTGNYSDNNLIISVLDAISTPDYIQ